VKGCRVGVLGLTFKENVPDLRNSRVPDILKELHEFGVVPLVSDPLADAADARHEYGVDLLPRSALNDLDALILAVPHHALLAEPLEQLTAGLRPGGVVVDIKSALDRSALRSDLRYWSL
jgi:UDP-N-acetyl-D-glucosamine/UDP-N-acetyl-D-galactosamine dehydrogenase